MKSLSRLLSGCKSRTLARMVQNETRELYRYGQVAPAGQSVQALCGERSTSILVADVLLPLVDCHRSSLQSWVLIGVHCSASVENCRFVAAL